MNLRVLSKYFLSILICLFASNVFATGQISDRFYFKNNNYSLIGLKGELVTPIDFGMETEPSSTANWRGFFSEYKVVDGKLLLSKITINAKNDKYIPINGIEADLEATKDCFMRHSKEVCTSGGGVYDNVDLLVPLTGKIRLGAGFINELYVHMGHQKPSAFQEVLDLEFKAGKLIKINDRSEEASQIRGKFQEYYYNSSSEKAVQNAFSLEMDELK